MKENLISISVQGSSGIGANVKVTADYPVYSDLTIKAASSGGPDANSHTFTITQGESSDEWVDHKWVMAEWQIISVTPEYDKEYHYVF